MTRRHALPAIAALTLLLHSGPARADAIDGEWCAPNGLRLTIRGPSIVTPGGARMTGDYDRHGFAYTAPAGEPAGGARVTMILMGETMMRVQADAPGLDPVWRRCGPPTS